MSIFYQESRKDMVKSECGRFVMTPKRWRMKTRAAKKHC